MAAILPLVLLPLMHVDDFAVCLHYLLYFTRFTGTEVHTDAEGALWTFAHADASGSKARARGAAMRACAVAKTGPTRPQRM
jgi:hypothetical protein